MGGGQESIRHKCSDQATPHRPERPYTRELLRDFVLLYQQGHMITDQEAHKGKYSPRTMYRTTGV